MFNYKDIEDEDSEGFNFDIRESERKLIKMKHFAEQCSDIIPVIEIIQEVLYVGGELIANSFDILKYSGITHIINCAGDVCKNNFPSDFTYLTFHLKDNKTEVFDLIPEYRMLLL